ncbi:hypothetical protein ACTD5D_30345 [Nocardia takedensis]|uniref:hypothetical protein n=1 Tax=Nocardia takedensis TaxID=259390 RepID=UPI0012F62B64|nr:hypothetical protein [Nocardia takedensis]
MTNRWTIGGSIVSGCLLAGAIVTAPTAAAALGSVVVDGSVHRDPGGCLEVGGGPVPLAVENHTDTTVTVFNRPGCRGDATVVLNPSDSATVPGSSVHIP